MLYTFDDIIIIPQMTTLRTRMEADTSVQIGPYLRPNPIISANMKSVTGSEMAKAMWDAGSIGALHRFMPVGDNVKEYLDVITMLDNDNRAVESDRDCLVSIGVKDYERAEALYDVGARMFVIDIAHGHSIQMQEKLKWMRDKWGQDVFIVAGNIATAQAAQDLEEWGADVLKVGIGPGSVCTTRKVTGHGVPQFSAIMNCSKYTTLPIIADGGIRSAGDIVKSIVAGADMVMMGGLLAPAIESGATEIGGRKIYSGSAYEPSRGQVAAEGTTVTINASRPVSFIVNELVAGVRSGMSYSNTRTLTELGAKAKWDVQSAAGYFEGLPHALR